MKSFIVYIIHYLSIWLSIISIQIWPDRYPIIKNTSAFEKQAPNVNIVCPKQINNQQKNVGSMFINYGNMFEDRTQNRL